MAHGGGSQTLIWYLASTSLAGLAGEGANRDPVYMHRVQAPPLCDANPTLDPLMPEYRGKTTSIACLPRLHIMDTHSPLSFMPVSKRFTL